MSFIIASSLGRGSPENSEEFFDADRCGMVTVSGLLFFSLLADITLFPSFNMSGIKKKKDRKKKG